MNQRCVPTRCAGRSGLGIMLAALATGALAAAPAQAAQSQMPGMDMGASPEHVQDAFAALKAGKASVAKRDLTTAIAASGEPKAAVMHAREALAAVTKNKLAVARGHAQNGAAVEHFTYSLRALAHGTIGGDATARGHLDEALTLPAYSKYAKAALAALARKDRTTAKAKVRQGNSAATKAA